MAAISPKKRNSIFDDSDDSDGDSGTTNEKAEIPKKVNKASKEENVHHKTKEKNKIKEKKKDESSPEQKSNTAKPPVTPEKDEAGEEKPKMELSPAQRAQIEKKRQQALLIRREKMNRKNPYTKIEEKKDNVKVVRIEDTKLIDTGGGFFIEENEGQNNEIADDDLEAAMKLVTEPAPLFEEDRPFCQECDHPFNNSFLFHNFNHSVCDQCRDNDDKHALITKTDAKNEYLLKDVDLEKREPPLQFIVRKNPHNSRWGDMKLYLKSQVEKRALEVWGTEEALEEAMEKKEEQRELSKQRKYKKKMKELRMNVRSSLYTRSTKTHEHEYGEEEYLPDEDEYSRTCKTCGHSYTYDKM